MPRPPSRSRRSRQPEPPPRRGRNGGRNGGRSGPARKAGPPPMLILGGGALVVVAGVIGLVAAGGSKKQPKKEPVSTLGPAVPDTPKVELPEAPRKEPPKPLTPEEKDWIDGLFRRAEPHMQKFHEYAAAGWRAKEEDEDEAEANAQWVKAKKEAQEAIQIVSEALEDYDRFPMERQDAYMQSYNVRLTQWTKDLAMKIGKVHVDK